MSGGYSNNLFSREYIYFIQYALYATTCVAVLLVLVAVVAVTDISRMSEYTYNDVSSIPYNRTGLVLGTSKYKKGGGINQFFKNRIDAAVDLYHAGRISYIVVSGDNANRSYNEPRLMRKELIKNGIPKDRIYLDYAGFRTLDSVVRIERIFKQKHVTIISQEFHNERAIYIARHHDIDAIGFNAANVPDKFFVPVIREFFARLKCLLDVYIFDSRPKFLGEAIEIGNSNINPKHAQLQEKDNNSKEQDKEQLSNKSSSDNTDDEQEQEQEQEEEYDEQEEP